MSVNYQNDNFPLEKKNICPKLCDKKETVSTKTEYIFFFIIWQYIYIYYIYMCKFL